jgi:hypothetical protein
MTVKLILERKNDINKVITYKAKSLLVGNNNVYIVPMKGCVIAIDKISVLELHVDE